MRDTELLGLGDVVADVETRAGHLGGNEAFEFTISFITNGARFAENYHKAP
jgi:hypothetical protein